MSAKLGTRTKTRKHPDILTVAYMALGAGDAWAAAADVKQEQASDSYSGQEGFIAEVIQHALVLDAMADKRGNNFTGVFCYEVAEPFGERYAKTLLDGDIRQPEALMRELLDTITPPEVLARIRVEEGL